MHKAGGGRKGVRKERGVEAGKGEGQERREKREKRREKRGERHLAMRGSSSSTSALSSNARFSTEE
jgi:hypothetical protein